MMDHVTITNEDLGIREDGTHKKAPTPVEERCIDILKRQGQGRDNALSAITLAKWVFADLDEAQAMRNVRELVNHLICTHSIPVCSMPGVGGGYWMPLDVQEVESVYQARRKRAFTGLVKMAQGRKSSYVDIVEQLTLAFDEPEGEVAIERLRLTPDKDPLPTWLKVVTRFLTMMDKDPQKYAAEIGALQKNFGDIFVPREKVRALRAKSRELEELLHMFA
jgi:hypothetical protein